MDKPPDQKTKPRIAYAERRVKPLARLLRCATALRVTAPLGCKHPPSDRVTNI